MLCYDECLEIQLLANAKLAVSSIVYLSLD